MNEDWKSVKPKAFFRWGMRISLRLTPKAHKKNRLVIRMKGTRKRRSVTATDCFSPSGSETRVIRRLRSGQSAVEMGISGVNKDVLAGNVAGSCRNQEHHHVGDLFRLGHSFSQRNLGNDPGQLFLGIWKSGEPLLIEWRGHFRGNH